MLYNVTGYEGIKILPKGFPPAGFPPEEWPGDPGPCPGVALERLDRQTASTFPISQEVFRNISPAASVLDDPSVILVFRQKAPRPGRSANLFSNPRLPLSSRPKQGSVRDRLRVFWHGMNLRRDHAKAARPGRPMRARAGRLNFPCAYQRFEKDGTEEEPWSSSGRAEASRLDWRMLKGLTAVGLGYRVQAARQFSRLASNFGRSPL